jgi:hypothetical protein
MNFRWIYRIINDKIFLKRGVCMFCKNCGSELKDTDVFCTGCGDRLTPSESSSAGPDFQQQPISPSIQQQPIPTVSMGYPTPVQTYPIAKKPLNWVTLLGTFLLPIPLAAFLFALSSGLVVWAVAFGLFMVNLVIQLVLRKKSLIPKLVVLLVCVFTLSGFATASYISQSPEGAKRTLSTMFRKPAVKWTQADLDSYINKTNVVFTEDMAGFDDVITGNYTTVGALEIDTFFTNEEATALINASGRDAGIFQNMSMRYLGNNRMEMSAQVGENLQTIIDSYPEVQKYESYLNVIKNRKIYIRTTLVHTTGNQFEAEIERMSVSGIPLPVGIINQNMLEMGSYTNNLLDDIEGLSIEQFEITDEGFHFKGTIPQQIKKYSNYFDQR